MTKRLVISTLWFVAIWAVGGVANLAWDVPRILLLIPALVVAASWWIFLTRYETRLAERRAAAVDRVLVVVDTGLGRQPLEA